jgi:hypothetical protein
MSAENCDKHSMGAAQYHRDASSLRYPSCVVEKNNVSREGLRAGLCADCLYARRIESARGSMFYLCERSASDPAFPKYPQLPVIECSGHTPRKEKSMEPRMHTDEH